jgi:hypothetical protein
MKVQFNDWQKEIISNWYITYSGILKWKWPELNEELKNTRALDFIKNEELKRAILSLHPNNFEEILHSTKLFENDDLTIYKLLNKNVSTDYSVDEAESLVKLYISSYWGFLCK